MPSHESLVELLEELRRLAATDPRLARSAFCELLDTASPLLDDLLGHLSRPGESRLRHLVASVARTRPDRERLVPHLLRWRDVETDEFARRIIDAALEGVEPLAHRPSGPNGDLPQLPQTYRYVAQRVCHKVRNSLLGPKRCVRQLKDFGDRFPDTGLLAEFDSLVVELAESLRNVARIVEFNVDDDYFAWRSVDLLGWLKNSEKAFAATGQHVEVMVREVTARARICANEFLLETVFVNLWSNACEIAEAPCRIIVQPTMTLDHVELLLLDNGPGFPPKLVSSAFSDPISTHGAGRGVGLLEVQDAVERLSGKVELTEVCPGEYRLRLRFPLDRP